MNNANSSSQKDGVADCIEFPVFFQKWGIGPIHTLHMAYENKP
jgi:hypothetical protein